MTSSDTPSPNYSRRFMWLLAFIILLFGGYSAGWFYVADRIESDIDERLAELTVKGITAQCANREVRGYPFRIGLYCDSVNFDEPERGVSVTGGAMRSAAQIYQPFHAVAELDPPLRVIAPEVPPLVLQWDNMRSSVRIAQPLPERISIEGNGVSGAFAPDGSEATPLFNATHLEHHLRPNGANLDWAGNFSGLEISPAAAQGRNVPILSGQGDISVLNGADMIKDRPKSLRGQAIEIRSLTLATGGGSLTLAGPVSVDADGLVDATLKLEVKNGDAVVDGLRMVFPEKESEFKTALQGMSFLGKDMSIPLTIKKSRMGLGFLSFGVIKPLP